MIINVEVRFKYEVCCISEINKYKINIDDAVYITLQTIYNSTKQNGDCTSISVCLK